MLRHLKLGDYSSLGSFPAFPKLETLVHVYADPFTDLHYSVVNARYQLYVEQLSAIVEECPPTLKRIGFTSEIRTDYFSLQQFDDIVETLRLKERKKSWAMGVGRAEGGMRRGVRDGT